MTALEASTSASPADTSSMLEKKRRGGRQPGALNFTQEDRDALLDMVETVRPQSKAAWEKVTEIYNVYATGNGRKARDTDSLTAQWRKMLTHPKPAQDVNCPPGIKRAKELYHDICSKGGVAGDGSMESEEMDVEDGEDDRDRGSDGKAEERGESNEKQEGERKEEEGGGGGGGRGGERVRDGASRKSRFLQTPNVRIVGGVALTPKTTSTPTSPSPPLQPNSNNNNNNQTHIQTPPDSTEQSSSSSSSSSSTLMRTATMVPRTTTFRSSTSTPANTSKTSGSVNSSARATTTPAASRLKRHNPPNTTTSSTSTPTNDSTATITTELSSLLSDPEFQTAAEENRNMQSNMFQLLQFVQMRQDLRLKDDKIERLEDKVRELERENAQLRSDKQILEMKTFMYQMQQHSGGVGEKKRKLDD